MHKKLTVFQFILHMTKPYRPYIWGIVFAMCCISIDGNIKPYLIKSIIDDVSNNDYQYIWLIIGIYAFSQFMMVWAWAFFDWCCSKYSPQLTSYICKTLLNKLSIYPYRFFQDQMSGNIVAKIQDAGARTPKIIETFMVEVFQIAITILLNIILLTTVHYWFGLALAVWVTIFMTITYLYARKANLLSHKVAAADNKIGGLLVDYFSNIFAIKIFTSRNFEYKRLESDLEDYINKSKAKILYIKSFFTRQGIIFSFYILGCLVSMVYLAQHKLVSAGDFALVFMLNFAVVTHLFHLATIMNDLTNNWGAIGQALTILDEKPDVIDKPGAKDLQIKQADITFDRVHFNYPDAETLFQNKSVTIKHGSKVGLVGYSGGGKTTFVNLIMRLYDVTDGQITIDNQDIRDITQDSLRTAIGMIPQDPTLFHRSLMENIRYGRSDASDAEVIAAAKQAHADEFINKLPKKYQSLVGERGVKLSGGQRQRIAIARTILRNAPILILDEATSQLDSVTEQVIQDSLWALMQNKTTIVIAHRLSTLLRMDRILVFENGNIVEDGTHKELLAKHGLYKSLWDAQVGGFLPD